MSIVFRYFSAAQKKFSIPIKTEELVSVQFTQRSAFFVKNKIIRSAVAGNGNRTDVQHKQAVSSDKAAHVRMSEYNGVVFPQKGRNIPAVVHIAVSKKQRSPEVIHQAIILKIGGKTILNPPVVVAAHKIQNAVYTVDKRRNLCRSAYAAEIIAAENRFVRAFSPRDFHNIFSRPNAAVNIRKYRYFHCLSV